MPELQRLRADHAPAVLAFELANRAYFAGFINDRGDEFYDHFAERHNAMLAEQEAGLCAFYVLVDDDGSVIGRFNLYDIRDGTADLGYRVAEHVAGRGVATAAVRELCQLAVAEYGLRTLKAATSRDNVASQKVLVKAGFRPVGPADPGDIGGKVGTWYQRDLAAGPGSPGRLEHLSPMERPLAPPEPPLSDGVIVLRPWRREDAPVLASVFGGADADLAYWMDEVPQPYTLAHAVAYVDRRQAGWRGEVPATPFAICDVVSEDVLGLTWDEAREGTVVAGYWMRREARGRGAAARALRLAAAWVFGDLGFARLELRIDTRNEPSRRVAVKAGFTLEGIRRSACVNARDGRRFDEAIYSLLLPDAVKRP